MATVLQIVTKSLKDIGVLGESETPTNEQAQDALDTLNDMLALWRTQTLKVYVNEIISVTANGSQSYTVGTGGDINVERPVSVEQVVWKLNSTDYNLTMIQAYEDYQSIGNKSITGSPAYAHYQPSYPLGTLYLFPKPSTGELYLTVKKPMPVYVTLQDDLSLPPEYSAAIRYNLNEWLALSFGMELTPSQGRAAYTSRKILKRNNIEVGLMGMPNEVMPAGRGYNIARG